MHGTCEKLGRLQYHRSLPCMYYAWGANHAWKGEAHACNMHKRENHAHSMHGMVDLCMYHACIMHDTCIHAWNTLKHACFLYRISSRDPPFFWLPFVGRNFKPLKLHKQSICLQINIVAKPSPYKYIHTHNSYIPQTEQHEP